MSEEMVTKILCPYISWSKMSSDLFIQLRRLLHSRPELSGHEADTADLIARFLEKHSNLRLIRRVGGHGLLAVHEFGEGGKTVLLRCELDALPIEEENNLPYKSTQSAVSHKCGHDGHMAILTKVALALDSMKFKSGRVVVLFQPAEETGEGARGILSDPAFHEFSPDHVIALHNLPGYEKGSVVVRPGQFNAEVISLVIAFTGETSHASEPEKGINPAAAIAEVIQRFARLSNSSRGPNMRYLTPIQIEMGEEAFGVSAGAGNIKYTLRTWGAEELSALREQVEHVVTEIATTFGLDWSIHWTQHFAACYNSPTLTEHVRQAAHDAGLPILEAERPFRFGEDFGLFTQQYDGVMFGLGAGIDSPPLHSPTYDFPDELIEIGAEMFLKFLERINS